MDILDLLNQQLSGGGLKQISRQIGADEQSTNQAISAAVPLLVSALARNTSQQGGADSLLRALQKDHDGSVLDDLMGYLGGGSAPSTGPAILGPVLGDRQSTVQGGLAKQTGLDAASIGRLLVMLAPMIMAVLGKAQRQNGFDAGALSGYLNGQREQAQTASPDLMGSLTSLLDSNKDGSILDDIAKKILG
jgi:hypothetical protein